MIRIHDIETNEVIDREMTEDEFAIFEGEQAEKNAAKSAAQEAKATAQEKLSQIGLTIDDLKALGL